LKEQTDSTFRNKETVRNHPGLGKMISSATATPQLPVSFWRFGMYFRSASIRTIRFAALIVCLALFASYSTAAKAEQGSSQKSTVMLPSFLVSGIDSKKLKAGDPVEARIGAPIELSNGVTIARDSKVTGHVTESKAKGKGDSESSITIAFDKIMMRDGKVLNIKASVQAVAPNPNVNENQGGVDYGGSMNRSMEHAGPGQTAYSTVPILNQQSTGVMGIKDVELSDDGVLKSSGKTVKLGHDTQLLLKTEVLGMQ
jgi:hypothetical protein